MPAPGCGLGELGSTVNIPTYRERPFPVLVEEVDLKQKDLKPPPPRALSPSLSVSLSLSLLSLPLSVSFSVFSVLHPRP